MANQVPRWPSGYSAAVSVTMDNMGEAAELFGGTWPGDLPIGDHFSVSESLPLMLALFESFGIRATYFIEAWNAGVYPDAIRSVQARGHEIAFHGWQHEPWGDLDHDREAALLSQSCEAFGTIGVHLNGFRPPGGRLTPSSIELLHRYGFTYCSPAASHPAIVDGLAILPFDWQGIDAYHYSNRFAPLRELKGDTTEPSSPERLYETFTDLIEGRIRTGSYIAILFHPFLEMDPERFDVMRRVVESVANHPDLWCAPCSEVASWIRSHPEQFPHEPGFDDTTWTAGATS